MTYSIIFVLTLIMVMNTVSLYNSFSSFINVNKKHLSVRQNKSILDFVLDRGIWLIRNGYQPNPYDRNQYIDGNLVVEIASGKTVLTNLTIKLVTKGTNHMDSTYDIIAEYNGLTKKLRFAQGKIVSYS